jgi:signal transduction histidine kinase/DNA-binding response OmpR family regulator
MGKLFGISDEFRTNTCLIAGILLFNVLTFGQGKVWPETFWMTQKKSDSFYKVQLYDSAYAYAKQNYDGLGKNAHDTVLINALIQLVKITDIIKKQEQEGYFGLAEKKALDLNSPSKLVDLYFTKGEALYEKQDFASALPYFLKIDSLSKTLGVINPTTIDGILRRAEISKLSFTRETTNMAHALLFEALAMAKEIKAIESEHLTYIQLSDINQMIRNFPEAKKYINLALPYFEKRDIEKRVSRLNLIKAAYYIGVDSLEKAEQTHLNLMAYLSKSENSLEQANAAYYYGNFLRRKKNAHAEALVPLEAAKAHFLKAKKDSVELYHRTLRDLAFCNQQIGNYKEASTYYQQAYDLKIELLEKFNRSSSKTLEAKYQTEKKEQEIALLKAQNEVTVQLQKSQRNFLLGGIGLMSIAGIFLFVLYRNRQRTNEKLKELDALKSHFFTNISHEFRTPLTLISAPIQAAMATPDLPLEQRKHWEMAYNNTNRLLSLVDQLLDLSKIDSGALKIQLEKGRPTQMIAAWCESFFFLAKQKQIELILEIIEKEAEAWFDRDAFEKITVNLLGNAIKYTPENGKVVVSASIENGRLLFKVSNTGKGLDKKQMHTIFDRFYQANGQNDGAGIGLSLVKELVALHQGNIMVDSTPDQWTHFKVSLCTDKAKFKNATLKASSDEKEWTAPIAFATNGDMTDSELEDAGLPLLLVVEDNPDIRLLLFDTFKTTYRVITANNGEEGIALALEQVPDLILSDVMMPLKDGIELTRILKEDERSSHIPIILLTAKAGDANELTGINVGADDYITKPFNQKLLLSKVASLIALRKKLQSRYSQEVILRPKDIAISPVDERFLEKVQALLDEKLVDGSFNTDAFSKGVHMSRMQLHRKLKALTGLSASEFVRSQRLKLATQLLRQSNGNISEVGYSVGFNDPAYFAKCFRDTYQCTPTEYAKRH